MTRTRRNLLGRLLGVLAVVALALTTVVATTQSSAVAAASGTGSGYLSTQGNQIVDATLVRRSASPGSTGSGWRRTTRRSTACGRASRGGR